MTGDLDDYAPSTVNWANLKQSTLVRGKRGNPTCVVFFSASRLPNRRYIDADDDPEMKREGRTGFERTANYLKFLFRVRGLFLFLFLHQGDFGSTA